MKQTKEAVVYKLTTHNDKIYVGVTVNIVTRMKAYRNKNNTQQPLLYRYICKYGFENIKVEILEEGSLLAMKDREVYYIALFRSNYALYKEKHGLNLTNGGDGVWGLEMPEYARQVIKAKAIERGKCPEYRKKLSDAHIGKPSALKGTKLSSERIERLRLLGTGRKVSDKTKEKLSILAKGNSYALGYRHTPEALYKISQTSKTQVWSEERRNKISESKKGNTYTKGFKHSEEFRYQLGLRKSKLILDLYTGIFYHGCNDAGSAIGVKYATLKGWLDGRSPNKSSMQWV